MPAVDPATQARANAIASAIAKLSKVRRQLGDAYNFVRGRESVAAFTSLTFEQLLQQRIDAIQGTPSLSAIRPSQLGRLAQLQMDMTEALDALATIPAAALSEDIILGATAFVDGVPTQIGEDPFAIGLTGANTLDQASG